MPGGGKVEVLRYHVDLETNQIGVEFRVLDEATGRYEPAPPHEGAIQLLALTPDVRAALDKDVLPSILADVLEVPEAHPAALTSALHQLRETRLETARIRRDHEERVQRARDDLARTQAEKQEAERLRTVAEEETNAILKQRTETNPGRKA